MIKKKMAKLTLHQKALIGKMAAIKLKHYAAEVKNFAKEYDSSICKELADQMELSAKDFIDKLN